MTEGKIDILKQIAEINRFRFNDAQTLTGGDINEVFLLSSSSEKLVIKLNSAKQFPGMFEAEKLGLETLSKPGVIDIPKPIALGHIKQYSYLILEYKQEGLKASDFSEKFGQQLAAVHKISSAYYGFESDNYIGSLPQYNDERKSTADYYIDMRLRPQFKMAEKQGFQLNIKNSFFENVRNTIPSEQPSLIHGDLWGGNYLINEKGQPCLIDPAVSFAPREMDLAMMKLFGGFDEKIFEVYQECFPLEHDWKARIPLYQLYYLLVHLNIFGTSYKARVERIISDFS